MSYKKEIDFIKETQKGILLGDYTLTDMLWFMRNYHDSEVEKLPLANINNNEVSVCDCKCKNACLSVGAKFCMTDVCGDYIKQTDC